MISKDLDAPNWKQEDVGLDAILLKPCKLENPSKPYDVQQLARLVCFIFLVLNHTKSYDAG